MGQGGWYAIGVWLYTIAQADGVAVLRNGLNHTDTMS